MNIFTKLSSFTVLLFKHVTTKKLAKTTIHKYSNRKSKLEHFLNVTMPKNASGSNSSKLRVVRYKEHCGGKLPIPSNIDVIVVGTGARGSSKSIMISTNFYRYLFNCGEGVQRIAVEYKYKLPRLGNIFLTSKSWDNIGGLLGAALTLESNNVPQINLHGPPQVEKLVRMAKVFNHNPKIQINMRDLDVGYHDDNAVRVDYVVLCSDTPQVVCEAVNERMFREEVPRQDTNLPQAKRICVEKEEDYVITYIITPKPKPRTLILEKCVDLGIPVGPQLSQLKDGNEVTLADGCVVHPDQVLSPSEHSRSIIVVECPSVQYLDSLLKHEKFTCLKHASTESPELICHMTPESVMAEPRYQEWMHSFSEDTQHLILNETASQISHERMYSLQAVLNLLSDSVFPLLSHQLDTHKQHPTMETQPNIHRAQTNLKYIYRPKTGFTDESCVKIDNSAAIAEVMELCDVPEALSILKEKLHHHPVKERTYPEVVFLGTGASQPSKVRNVSSILVHVSPDSSILMDCGESTLTQIYSNYGNRADDVLRNIRAILVTHMHADHHLVSITGTFSVASARHAARLNAGLPPTKLLLLAPVQMTRWLLHYTNHICQIHHCIRLVSLQDLMPSPIQNLQLLSQILNLIGLTHLSVVEVAHCNNAFGFVVGGEGGWRVAYSGDTMPCDRLVNAGQGCDLLIHEATMEDELEEEARLKTHSTTSQALDVGRRMNAKFTILTHFSQRYAKIPVFDDKFGDNFGVAFDNMRVCLSDLPLLPLFIPVLKVMFQEERAELQQKTSYYVRKRNKHQLTDEEREEFYGSAKT